MTNKLDTLIDSFLIGINEEIITNLSTMGYSHDEAVAVVAEFGEFDLAAAAVAEPVSF
jgi:hypothetical protein